MPFDFQRARPLLHSGDLAKLFVEELGCEVCRQKLTLPAGVRDEKPVALVLSLGIRKD